LWRNLADLAEKYLTKGSTIYLEGKLKTRSYQDKNGINKYVTEIIGDKIIMLD
jgi:single-strand DNA-binding protein